MISRSIVSSLTLLLACVGCYGSSILAFFPLAVPSHHRVFQPLVKGLLDRGHQVTYYTPFTMSDPPQDRANYTEVLIHDFMVVVKKEFAEMTGSHDETKYMDMVISQQLMLVMMKYFGYMMAKHTMKDQKFQDLISSDSKFDLVLYCGTFMQEIYSPLGHRFRAPIVEVLPAGNFHYTYWMHGNPFDTSYIVDFSVSSGDRMSLLEKVENTFNSVLARSVWYFYYWSKYEDLMNELFRYPGWESRPSLGALLSNTSMVLMNTHYSLNYPYPLSPNFKEIGGINIINPKPLAKDLQNFMDSAPEGVVYFSFGSHLNETALLKDGRRQAFISAFSQVPQKVLWKTESNVPDLPPNVRTSKWFPQQSILSHKNCKLFITHGGFLSQTEGLFNRVPMIGIPILADQLKNVKHFHLNGYGVLLKLSNITEQSVLWAVRTVIRDPRYANQAKKQSEIFRDKPETALETAVFWTEYVIRHKGAHHLRPAIATMPWYQQAMIDVYAAIAAVIITPLYILHLLLKLVLRSVYKLFERNNSSNENKQTLRKNKKQNNEATQYK